MRRRGIWIGGALLAAMVAIALLSPYLVQADPRALSPGSRLLAPVGDALVRHRPARPRPLRPCAVGRPDLAFRRRSVAVLSALIGTAVGMLSASSRGLDAVVMRVMDGVMSIPAILLAIALMAVAGASVVNVIAAVTVVEIPRVARLVRGVVLSLREQPYVEAAIAVGTPRPMIMIRHMLPGVVPPLIVQATFIWATAMILEAALSFIGAGTPPSTPSWATFWPMPEPSGRSGRHWSSFPRVPVRHSARGQHVGGRPARHPRSASKAGGLARIGHDLAGTLP